MGHHIHEFLLKLTRCHVHTKGTSSNLLCNKTKMANSQMFFVFCLFFFPLFSFNHHSLLGKIIEKFKSCRVLDVKLPLFSLNTWEHPKKHCLIWYHTFPITVKVISSLVSGFQHLPFNTCISSNTP